MRTYRLTNQERAGLGFTHQIVVDYKDLTAAATTQIIDLVTLTQNTIIDDIVVLRIDDPFLGTGGNLGVEIGIASDADYNVASLEVKTSATAGTIKGPAGTAESAANRFCQSSSNAVYQAKFTSSSGNVTAATAGQISVFFRMVNGTDLGFDQA